MHEQGGDTEAHPPSGSGDNPDVAGIDEGPLDADPSENDSASRGADSGGRAHTEPGTPHPDLHGERTDRDVGGPTSAEDPGGDDVTGSGKGTTRTKGFDSHD